VIGLFGFGLTTTLLGLANANVYHMNSMVLAMAFAYGGLAQILAGIFEFMRGSIFGMLVFISYGFFWWTFLFTHILPEMGLG
jgi:succinate-acetate transporter protein